MKLRRLGQAACLFALILSQTAQAMYISEEDRVTVNNATWAQVDLFRGPSWNEINSQCPAGICGSQSSLLGLDMAGWIWAISAEVSALFNYYLTSDGVGGDDLMDPDNTDDSLSVIQQGSTAWIRAIAVDFRSNDYDHTGGYYLSGFAANPIGQLYGANSVYWGTAGRNSRVWASSRLSSDPDRRADGAWFYCTSNCPAAQDVPLPSVLWLILLGLAPLVGREKRFPAT